MRECLLCPNKTPVGKDLCYNCYKLYKQYKHEDWYKELRKMQNKQAYIDAFEPTSIYTLFNVQDTKPELLSMRNIGRPKIDYRIYNAILEEYDDGVSNYMLGIGKIPSLRVLAKKYSISAYTIRGLLKKHRNKEYTKYNTPRKYKRKTNNDISQTC